MKFQRIALPLMVIFLAFGLSACGGFFATQNFPGLVLDDDILYISAGSHVHAIDVTSGQEVLLGNAPLRFPKDSDNNVILFAPVALTDGGQMVVPNSHPSNHGLYSVERATGIVRWTFEGSKGTWIAGSLTLNDTIYAPGGEGILYALDMNGNERWSTQLSNNGLMAHPVTNGDLIFVPTMDGILYALNPANGSQVWQRELNGPIMAPPLLDEDGNMYIGTLSGRMFSLQAASGAVNWEQKLDGTIWSAPILDDETLYIGVMVGKEGRFYALQQATGAIRWQRSEEGSILASPLAFDGKVLYVTELGRVQALSSDGTPQWQADLKGKLVSGPILAGDLILIVPMQGDDLLVAFDVNGAQRWTFKP
jgi:outer membrane protein assembly factor BamB